MKTIEYDNHYRFDSETEEKLKEIGITFLSRFFNLYYDNDNSVGISAMSDNRYMISWNFCVFGGKPGENTLANLKRAKEKYILTEKAINILEGKDERTDADKRA